MIRFVKEIEINKGNLSGWINIFLDTVTDTYLVSADFNEVKDEIYKEGFKTIGSNRPTYENRKACATDGILPLYSVF